ncbi:MAG TPA: hypothetical protein VN922_20450 [Bacteroidia bacterium]|nr:hypothetical protein [Bacteroidia bacterium]
MKNHHHNSRLIISAFLLFIGFVARGQQVTIVSADVNAYNVTPRGLCQVVLMNPATNVQVLLQAQLLDAANEPLVTVKTNPFMLHNGMNASANMNFSISSVEYGATSVVQYIRNSSILPTGKYSYCVKVIIVAGNAEEGDNYCEELESDINSYLYLVSPEDKDTINTPNPVLVWNHSDPFNTLGPGEYYRMLLVPVNEGQTADEAITVNTPIYFKNNLEENQVQYPFDAPTLEPGKHYGWQVQLISNDVIANKTEAWEFIEYIHIPLKDNKYAVMKTSLDGGFYVAANNRIFFRFDETYATSNAVECVIFDSQMKPVKSRALDDAANSENADGKIALKQQGYNQYEVDLNNMNVKSGFYYLQVKNAKGQVFILKLQVL